MTDVEKFSYESGLDSWTMLITQAIIEEASKEEAEKLFSINRKWITERVRKVHHEEIDDMDKMLQIYIDDGKAAAFEYMETT